MPSPRVTELLMQGADSLQHDDLANAVLSLKEAAQDKTAPAGVYHLLAIAYLREKKPADAVQAAAKAVDLTPKRTQERAENDLLLARAQYADFRAEEAKLYERLKAFPLLINLISKAADSGRPPYDPPPNLDWPTKNKDTDAEVEFSEEQQQLRVEMAKLHDEIMDAQSHAKASVAYDDSQFGAHDLLGLLYTAEGDVHVARQEFGKELANSGQYSELLEHKGELDLETDSIDEGIAELRNSVRLDPTNTAAYRALANIFQQQNRFTEMRWARGMYDLYKGSFDAARKEFEQMPHNADYYCSLGMIGVAQKDYTSAENLIRQALAANARDIPSLLTLAFLQCKRNDYAGASGSYDSVIAIDPDCEPAWVGKGIVLDSEQRYPDAATAYTRALALSPSDATALLNRASDRAQMKQVADATSDLQVYLHRFPSTVGSTMALTLLSHLQMSGAAGVQTPQRDDSSAAKPQTASSQPSQPHIYGGDGAASAPDGPER